MSSFFKNNTNLTESNKLNLRKLLSGASIASIIIGSSCIADANTLTVNAFIANTNFHLHWNPNQLPADGDTLKPDGRTINFNQNNDLKIAELNLEGRDAVITISTDNTVDIQALNAGGADLDISFLAGSEDGKLILTDANSLPVSIDFKGITADVNILNGDVERSVDSSLVGDAGRITLSGNTSFQQTIGTTNALSEMNLDAGSNVTILQDSKINSLKYNGNATFKIDSNASLTGDVDFGGNADAIFEIDNGTIFKGHLVANAGDAAAIAGKVVLGGASIDIEGSLTNIDELNIATNNTTINANVSFTANKITESVGNPVNLITNGFTSITFADGGADRTSDANINYIINADKYVALSGDGTISGQIHGSANSIGNLLLNPGLGNTLSLNGEVGGNGNSLESINLSGGDVSVTNVDLTSNNLRFSASNARLTITNGHLNTNIDFAGQNNAELIIDGGNINGDLDGDLAGVNSSGIVRIRDKTTINGIVGKTMPVNQFFIGNGELTLSNTSNINQLTFNSDGIVHIDGKRFTGDINFNSHDGVLTLIDGSEVIGDITSNLGTAGILDVQGVLNLDNANITNISTLRLSGNTTIGNTTIEVNRIDGVAPHNLTVAGGTNINFINNAAISTANVNYLVENTKSLKFSGSGSIQGTIEGSGAGEGILHLSPGVGNTLEIAAEIGGNGNSLERVEIESGNIDINANISSTAMRYTEAGAAVNIHDNTFDGAIDFNNQVGTLTIENNGQVTGNISGTNTATLILPGVVTLGGNVTDLAELKITGNSTLGNANISTNQISSTVGAVNYTINADTSLTLVGNGAESSADINYIINNNVTLSFGGDGSVLGAISGAGINQGILELSPGVGNTLTLNGAIGAGGNALSRIDLNGGTISLGEDLSSTETRFTSQSTLDLNTHKVSGTVDVRGTGSTIIMGAGSQIDGAITSSAGGASSTFRIDGDSSITGDVGGIALPNIIFTGDHDLSITGPNVYLNDVTTSTTNQGVLRLDRAGGDIDFKGNVGAIDKVLKEFHFGDGAAARTLTISDASAIYADEIDGGHANSLLLLNNDLRLNGKVTNTDAQIGNNTTFTLETSNNLQTIFNGTIDAVNADNGTLHLITPAGRYLYLRGAVGSNQRIDSIIVDGTGMASIDSDVTVNSLTYFDTGTFNVGSNTLTADVDFGNHAAILRIVDGVVDGDITSTGGINGTIDVSGNIGISGNVTNVSALQLIGDTQIGDANIEINNINSDNGARTFTIDGSTDFKFIGNAAQSTADINYIVNNGHTLTFNEVGSINGTIDGQANNQGVLHLNPGVGNTINLNGLIGNANNLSVIEINQGNVVSGIDLRAQFIRFTDAGSLNIQGNAVNGFVDFNNQDGTLYVRDGGTVGSISGHFGTANTAGTLDIQGWVNFTGSVNSIQNLHLSGDATLGDVDFKVEDIASDNIGNVRSFIANGADTRVTFIGGAGTSSDDVNYIINAGKSLTFNSTGTIEGTISGAAANTGTLILNPGGAGTLTVNGVVGGGGNHLNLVNIDDGTVDLNADLSATDVRFTDLGALNINGHTLTGNIDFNGNNGALSLRNGSHVTGLVSGNAADANAITGSVEVQGQVRFDSDVTGISVLTIADDTTLNTNTNISVNRITAPALKKLNVNSEVELSFIGNAAQSTADVNYVISTPNSLTFNGNGTVNGNIYGTGVGQGDLVVTPGNGNTITLNGVIGDGGAGETLASVSIGEGTTILGNNLSVMGGGSNVKFTDSGTLDIQRNTITGNISFNNHNGILRIGANGSIAGGVDNIANAANVGTIIISGDNANITGNLGVINNLIDISFSGNHDLQIDGDNINFRSAASTNTGEGRLYFNNAGDVNFSGKIGWDHGNGSIRRLAEFTWADGANARNLTITGDSEIYADSIDGQNVLSSIDVDGGNLIFQGAGANITTIRLQNGRALTLDGNGAAATIVPGSITVENDNNGLLILDAGAQGIIVNGEIGDVGGNKKLSEVRVNSGTTTLNADLYATSLNYTGDATLSVIGGTIRSNIDFGDHNSILRLSNSTVDGTIDLTPNIGKTATIEIDGNVEFNDDIKRLNYLRLISDSTIKATRMNTENYSFNINSDAPRTLTFDSNVEFGTTNITQNVNSIINNGKTLTFNGLGGTSLYGRFDGENSGQGTIILNDTFGNAVFGEIGSVNPISQIKIGGKNVRFEHNVTTSNANGGANSVLFTADSSLEIFANRALKSNIDFNNTVSNLILNNNSTVHGNIDSAGGDNGLITVQGDAFIAGKIGVNNKSAIRFAGDHKLSISGSEVFISKAYVDTEGEGILSLTAPIPKFSGYVGYDDNTGNPKRINKFQWGGGNGAQLTIKNDTKIYANNIDGRNPNSSIKLDGGNLVLQGDLQNIFGINIENNEFLEIYSDAPGAITVASAITTSNNNQGSLSLFGGVNGLTMNARIGAAGNALSEVAINPGTVTLNQDLYANSIKFVNGGILNVQGQKATAMVDFAGTNGVLKLGANGQIDGDVLNSLAGDNGTVTINGDNAKVTGNFGGNFGVNLVYNGDHTFTIEGQHLYFSGVAPSTNGKSKLHLNHAGNITLAGAVGKNNHLLGEFRWGDVAGRELNFLDEATIYSSNIGGQHANSTINVNKNLTIGGTINANASTTIQAGKILKIMGDATGGTTYSSKIDGNANGEGTIRYEASGNNITVGAEVGSNHGVGNIIFDGGETFINHNVTTSDGGGGYGTITFENDAKIDVDNGAKLSGNITLSGHAEIDFKNGGSFAGTLNPAFDGEGIIDFEDGNFAGTVGKAGLSFERIRLGSGDIGNNSIYSKTIEIMPNEVAVMNDAGSHFSGNVEIGANSSLHITTNLTKSISGNITGDGTLKLSHADALNAGTLGNGIIKIGSLDLNASADVNRDFTSLGETIIRDDIRFKSPSTLTTDTLLIAADKTVILELGANLVAPNGVGGLNAQEGNLVLSSGRILPKTTAKGLGSIILGSSEEAYIANDSYQIKKIILEDNATLKLDGDTKFSADLSLGSSNLILNDHIMNVNSLSLNDNIEIVSSMSSGNSMGHVITSSINGAKNNILLEITNPFEAVNGSVLTLLSSNVGDFPDIKFTDFTQAGINHFVFDEANGKIRVERMTSELKKEVLDDKSITEGIPQKNLDALADISATGDLAKVQDDLKRIYNDTSLTQLQKDERERKIIHSIAIDSTLQASEQMRQTATNVNHLISTRMANQAAGAVNPGIGSANFSGVAAGDEDNLYGHDVWAEIIGSKAKMKKKGITPGFDSSTYAGVFGADTMTSDNIVLGFAIAHADGKLKLKDQKQGDTTKTTSYIATIYGRNQFTDNIYARANLMLGHTNVHTHEKKYSVNKEAFSDGKYTSQMFGAEIGIGYIYNMKNMYLIPEIGLKGTMFSDGGYTETGEFFNRTITKRKGYNGYVHSQVRAGTSFSYYEAKFFPSLYVGILNELGGKNPEVSTRLSGQNIPFVMKSKTLNRNMFNSGVDLRISYGNIDYSLGYDLILAEKFITQSGTLKVRINL